LGNGSVFWNFIKKVVNAAHPEIARDTALAFALVVDPHKYMRAAGEHYHLFAIVAENDKFLFVFMRTVTFARDRSRHIPK
jgi:hypothetical protein